MTVNQPKIYQADEHEINPSHIDPDAFMVLKTLQEHGHVAYLVGGSVRDLLIKKRPKDFDISTSAKPEEIKRIFQRQCLLIGRRFRLAHIRFGNKIVEVSTFRTGETGNELIVRDNEWGTPAEDALRRDFTINGLFLDPADHKVIDYVGGWEDIHQGLLRTIGDPNSRFRQDPVRMIRLLKFRARFGFALDPPTHEALLACRDEIVKSSPARVLEEVFRMLESGSSEAFFQQLMHFGILKHLFPWLANFFYHHPRNQVYPLLHAADRTNRKRGKPLDRAVLATCLVFPILEQEVRTQFTDKGKQPHLGEVIHLANSLVRAIAGSSFSLLPRRIKLSMAFILSTQYRLIPLQGPINFRVRVSRHPDFELALDFLNLRTLVDDSLVPHHQQWRAHLSAHPVHPPRKHPPETAHRRPSRHRHVTPPQ